MRWWPILAVACVPTLDDPTPYVSEPRVLAVQIEPPEGPPNGAVTLTALYAGAEGPVAEVPVDWALCTARKPLAEPGPVASDCLDPGSSALVPLGSGASVSGSIAQNACALFGPDPPPPLEGGTYGRPTDPDVTGGYHQPAVGFSADGDIVVASVRVRCNLPGVSQQTYVAWNLAYRNNENPLVAGVALVRGGEAVEVPLDDAGEPPVVTPGETVTLRASWPACPEAGTCGDGVCSHDETRIDCPADCEVPRGCSGSETYVLYDAATEALVTRREAISASWYASGGEWADARTGRAGDDRVTDVANTWTAPSAAGPVWLAVVLRDERGGVAFAGLRLTVGP